MQQIKSCGVRIKSKVYFPATFNQQALQYNAWDICITSHWIFLQVSIHKKLSPGDHNKATSHKTISTTFIHISHGVKESNTFKNRNSFLVELFYKCGAHGGAVGLGTAVQAGGSRVRFPMVLPECFIDNLSDRNMALGLSQPLTQMSTSNISWRIKAAGA